MKRIILVLTVLAMTFVLVSCGSDDEGDGNFIINAAESRSSEDEITEVSAENEAETAESAESTESTSSESADYTVAAVRLAEDFPGALNVQAQLALGIVQLEETGQAVDETQAAELLPLWQALQTLSQSDTTADIELQAVVNSIQDTMTSEQLAAIAEMKLTEETMTALMESGELGIARGGRGFGGGAGGAGGGAGGGLRGGGLPGGGGGGFPGGGPGGLGGGDLSEDDIATRQAEFEENGFALIQDRLLTGMVTRLLQDKMGVVSEGAIRGNIMNEAFTAVADAAGLSVEELQAQMGEGQTMVEIVQSKGGDISILQSALIEIFSELPNAGDLDLEQSTADWLGVE